MSNTGRKQWKGTVVKGDTTNNLYEDYFLEIRHENVKILSTKIINMKDKSGNIINKKTTQFLPCKDNGYSEPTDENPRGKSIGKKTIKHEETINIGCRFCEIRTQGHCKCNNVLQVIIQY